MKTNTLKEATMKLLEERGLDLPRISEIAYDTQLKYVPTITKEMAYNFLLEVLDNDEVQHIILTALSIDKAAEQGVFDDTPLGDILKRDEGLYGPDESLALSLAHLYGTIAESNFGYLDIVKPSIIGELNDKELQKGKVHTFADDIAVALAAGVCSKLARVLV